MLEKILQDLINSVQDLTLAINRMERGLPPVEPVGPAEKELEEIGFEDIRSALEKLVAQKGRGAAVEVLEGFGGVRLSQIAPQDYGKIMEAIRGA